MNRKLLAGACALAVLTLAGCGSIPQALDLTAIVPRTRGRALGYVVVRAELGLIEHFHKGAGKINDEEFRTGHDGTELEGLTIQRR